MSDKGGEKSLTELHLPVTIHSPVTMRRRSKSATGLSLSQLSFSSIPFFIWTAVFENNWMSDLRLVSLEKVASAANLGSSLIEWRATKQKELWCRRHERWGFDPWVGKIPGEGNATHSIILAWEIPWQRSLVAYSPWVCRVGHNLTTEKQQSSLTAVESISEAMRIRFS